LNGSTGQISLNVGSSLSSSTNGSSITFGLASNITTVLQSAGAYLTTARASNDGIGLNSALTAGPLSWTVNSSGLSLNAAGAAGTTSGFAGNQISGSMTHNTAGLNLSVNHPAWITTAMLSNAVTISNIKFSAGTLSSNRSDISFNNGNGVSFGLETNGVITATVKTDYLTTAQPVGAYLTTAMLSNASSVFAGTGTTFNGANISGSITQNSNGINLSLSAAAPGGGGAVNFSAGTTSNNLQTVVFSNSNGVSFGLNGSTLTASVNAGGGATVSTYIPYYPASTGAQTIGAQGVTSASAWFFPVSIVQPVHFNHIRQLMTNSWLSSSVSYQHTVTHQFGLFSNNAGTLSLISSGSYSIGVTGSSVSATLSAPVSFNTDGGYTYTTFAATTTAQAQSLWGTAGNKIMSFGFTNSVSLSEGLYWVGIHQRQSSSGANGGNAFALGGNVMAAAQNAGPIGFSTAAFTGTGNTLFKVPWGVATSTGSAGYGGSKLPDAVNVTAMGMTVTQMPMMTFIY
jgi:hypothetical protein